MINKVFNRKQLARVSAVPGKTATINFFRLETVRFADLPGYGYAKVGKGEKERWSKLIDGYFRSGRNIGLVFQLVDIRHKPSRDDLQMIDFLIENEFPFVLILTKKDKLTKTQLAERLEALQSEICLLYTSAKIRPEDTVVLAGDTSWGMSFAEAKADFEFVNALPGQKIILKGNHDYWWATMNKMNAFFAENGFDTLHILHNNHYLVEGVCICGSRGWLFDQGEPADQKVIAREAGRLEASILSAGDIPEEKVVFLHYPPVYGEPVSYTHLKSRQKMLSGTDRISSGTSISLSKTMLETGCLTRKAVPISR